MAQATTQGAPLEDIGVGEGRRNPISLLMLIIMLETAVVFDLGDLVEFIPVVGTVIAVFVSAIAGVVLGFLMWISGARAAKQLATVVIGVLAESVPFLSVLPLNTVMVILVYLMGSQTVGQALEKAPGLAKKLPAMPRA